MKNPKDTYTDKRITYHCKKIRPSRKEIKPPNEMQLVVQHVYAQFSASLFSIRAVPPRTNLLAFPISPPHDLHNEISNFTQQKCVRFAVCTLCLTIGVIFGD